jgi:hypothetical protein
MFRSSLIIAAVALTAFSTAASAKHVARFRVIDGTNGSVLFDDGKFDGKACAVGPKASFNPATGKFTTKLEAVCN